MKIKLLPENVYNKIAAGEVVQRPSSVVKELIENSIDANSTKISVFVKEAGKKLIHVEDNGSGISSEDLENSIKKHATSKIDNISDLDSLVTFGFRGEALSSISAVSNFEIKTKTNDENVGHSLIYESEKEIIINEIPFNNGTSVSVKNLFYNVPARKNFMRSNSTEMKSISDIFRLFAISNPSIEFELFQDGKRTISYKKTDLQTRINDVFGQNYTNLLIEIDEKTELLKVRGFIAKPTFLTNSKGMQFSFVNNRFVRSKTINHAVFSSYEELLNKGDYPFFILFIEIEPNNIDINIHPTKEEIKFYDENQIYNLIKSIVKKFLGSYEYIPKTEKKKESNLRIITSNEISSDKINSDDLDTLFFKIDDELKSKTNEIQNPLEKNLISNKGSKSVKTDSLLPKQNKFIQLLHDKFIISQIKSGIMFINFYEAKRKIFYEKALNYLQQISIFSQQLLFPEQISLTTENYKFLQKNDNLFSKIGFEIKYLSKNRIEIVGVPPDVNNGNEKEIFRMILKDLLTFDFSKSDELVYKVAKSYANILAEQQEIITEQYLRLIVDKLFATENPEKGIEGKLIITKYTLEEIDKKFG